MRYEELPASVRAQVDAQLGEAPKRKRSQKAATEGTTSRWRCWRCGAPFAFESGPRGYESHEHGIIECVL